MKKEYTKPKVEVLFAVLEDTMDSFDITLSSQYSSDKIVDVDPEWDI